ADTDAVGQDLTAVAEAALDAALALLAPTLPFCVIGLGRFGAGELSYASDLDVVFVYDGSGPEANTEAIRCARGVLQLLGAHTAEGRVWEIDARLRPEGENGQLARSLEGYRRYYQDRARLWEFQSLVKARLVAGDADLGRAFVEMVEPFVFTAEFGDDHAAEIRHMKGRIERERVKPGTANRDLKLGPGGLADIEFTVQLLQLVHGHAIPAVRQPSTAGALGALAEHGVLENAEAEVLLAAYRFAERLRNRRWLHLAKDADLLPDDQEELDQLGRICGFDLDPAESLTAAWREVADAARTVVLARFHGGTDPGPDG
ncbi:MAG: hypothetical protein KDB21_03370, partial [Acidimicrobiales bacterium]|nr:hypothetical protein [Acidimicrobiales bacterium]